MDNPKKKKRIWRYVILTVLFIGMFIQYQGRSVKRHFSDFHVPYTVGHKLLAGEKIYSYEKGLSYFKYTPFYANLMVPLSILPERWAANIWYVFNFFSLMVMFHCARKIIIPDDEYDPLILYAITLWAISRILIHTLHEGQANIFMLTLLTLGLYFYVQKKTIQSAFFIAFSVMTKYMPVLFLPYFLLKKEFRLFLYTLVFIIFFNLMPALGFGFHKLFELIQEQLNFLFASSLDPWSIYCHPNQSLLGFIARTFWEESIYPVHILKLSRPAIFAIFFIVAAILYLMSVIPAYRNRKNAIALNTNESRWGLSLDFGLLFICMPLFNPNGWMDFFVCLIFPYMVVISHLLKTKFKDILVLILGISSVAFSCWTSELMVDWFAGDDLEIRSSVTIGTFFLFAALLFLKLRHLKTTRNN